MISPIRHFTATTFIVFQEGIFLHWHKKIEKWLPPGGHIDSNEDPVTAALREVKEAPLPDRPVKGLLTVIFPEPFNVVNVLTFIVLIYYSPSSIVLPSATHS